MAFTFNSLRTVGFGSNVAAGRSLAIHHYVTTEAASVIETAAYFNAAYKQLAKGDIIFAVCVISGTPVLRQYVVTASSASGVTIAAQNVA
jgi:hypothetical protein